MDAANLDKAYAQGEKAEATIDSFIAKRDKQRRKDEGERPAEEMYEESCRRHEEQERRELEAAWREHWRRMRAVHRGLAGEYDEKLKRLEQTA